ncbi:hypothetical protein L7F22_020785 [Adiantum nelumboides]|nr:hypothetical protein [Adiantum nelumboides]
MRPLIDKNATYSRCSSFETQSRCLLNTCSVPRKQLSFPSSLSRVSLLNLSSSKLGTAAASSKTFLLDFDGGWSKCSHLAASSSSYPMQIAASNVDPSCSDGAFTKNKSTSQYAVSLEEVQLPPIPRVFSPLRDLVPRAFDKVILPNGLRVFLMEDHELGLVGGQLFVKAGSKNDPADKVGLATISSIVQRSGGTKQHPGDFLDIKLEETAARIESSSGVSETSVGFRCLSEDLTEIMSLFSEVVQSPIMPINKLNLARTQLLGSIKRRGDNPGGIAAREFSKLLYGEKSAYSRYFSEETLKCITRDDLVAFHTHTFSPTTSILGIWGDFDQEKVRALISRTLGSWNDNRASSVHQAEQVGSVSQLEVGYSFLEPHIYVVNKPGLNQGFVRMGELGTTISDPDVFALDVLNDILNGFGGLLFNQVQKSKTSDSMSCFGSN